MINQGPKLDKRHLPITLEGIATDYLQEPINRPSGMPLNAWIQCVQGDGEVIIGGQRAVAREGMGILLLANVPYAYRGIDSEWVTNYITFSGSTCEQVLTALHLGQSGVCHISDPKSLSRHFHELSSLRKSSEFHMNRELSKALYSFLLDISLNIQYIYTGMPTVRNEALQRVIQYIEENFYEPIQLAELAELVGLRKEYLCTLFKKHMGQTIFHFIQTIRIAHARIYLTQFAEKTVKEIGNMSGFESASYFCRVFRQFEQLSPQEYRRTH